MFESVESKAIFSWLHALVTVCVVLWYALGSSQKQVAGRTLKEALVLCTSGNLRLGVIATLAVAASYYFDASNAFVTLFGAIPEELLLPAGFLYDLAVVVFVIAMVVDVVELQSYKHDLADAKSRNRLYASMTIRAITFLTLIGIVTFMQFSHLLWNVSDISVVISSQSSVTQYLYMNPGFIPLIALVTLAHLVHNHRRTIMAEPAVNKTIQTTCAVVIAYITVSLVALQVLSATAALVVFAFVAFDEALKMKSLIKKIA